MLKDKDLTTINRNLKELQEIKHDLEKAQKAGVPMLEELINRCVLCDNQMVQLKAIYFPNKA